MKLSTKDINRPYLHPVVEATDLLLAILLLDLANEDMLEPARIWASSTLTKVQVEPNLLQQLQKLGRIRWDITIRVGDEILVSKLHRCSLVNDLEEGPNFCTFGTSNDLILTAFGRIVIQQGNKRLVCRTLQLPFIDTCEQWFIGIIAGPVRLLPRLHVDNVVLDPTNAAQPC